MVEKRDGFDLKLLRLVARSPSVLCIDLYGSKTRLFEKDSKQRLVNTVLYYDRLLRVRSCVEHQHPTPNIPTTSNRQACGSHDWGISRFEPRKRESSHMPMKGSVKIASVTEESTMLKRAL